MDRSRGKRLYWLLSAHSILLIGSGIAFALYGPLMMSFFGVPDLLGMDAAGYWNLTSFARMFGAALFGFGLLIFSMRSALQQVTSQARRGALFALLLANLMSAFVSITQQSAVWGTSAGWITTGIFVLLTIVYGYFVAGESASKAGGDE
jgi:hypothetical protein